MNKILIINMLGVAEVASIGIPALRYVKQQFPDAEVQVLSFAEGKRLFELAEPDCTVWGLENGQWPDDFFPALEAFLGLAEHIVGEGYKQIIQLDTAFLPCFLARFLKDAGEPVAGNYLSMSVQELLDGFSRQTLTAEYVNNASEYLLSTFTGMPRWFTRWWEGMLVPDGGFPEFYLRACCGFEPIDMQQSLQIAADAQLSQCGKTVVALSTEQPGHVLHYPYGQQLTLLLQQTGVEVWNVDWQRDGVEATLAKLKASNLLVAAPTAGQWLANLVGCTTLVISGQVDPRSLMPDYATDMSESPIEAAELAEDILTLLAQSE